LELLSVTVDLLNHLLNLSVNFQLACWYYYH